MLRFLVLAALCLQGVLLEQSRILEQRKPFFERFRRLEEQFRRFQEVTLTRLQGIAENYNISYNIDQRFEHIAGQQRSLAEAFNASGDAARGEMDAMKVWLKKTQKKTKKLDLKMSSLEESVAERNKQTSRESKARDGIVSNLTSAVNAQRLRIDKLVKDKSVLHKGMEMLREVVKRQGGKIAALEEQVRGLSHNDILPPRSLMAAQELNRTPETKQRAPPGIAPVTAEQRKVKLQTKHDQRKKFHEEQQLLIPKGAAARVAARHGNAAKTLVSPNDKPPGITTARPPPVAAGDKTLERPATHSPPSNIHDTPQPPRGTEEKMLGIASTTRPPRGTHETSPPVHAMRPPSRVIEEKPPSAHTTRPPPRVIEEKPPSAHTMRPPSRVIEEKPPSAHTMRPPPRVIEEKPPSAHTMRPPPRVIEEKPPSAHTMRPPSRVIEEKPPSAHTMRPPPRVIEEKPPSAHTMRPPPRVIEGKSPFVHTMRPPPRATDEKTFAIGATRPAPRIMVEEAPGLRATTAPPTITKVPSTTEQRATKVPGTICNVDSMLTFPSPSTENFATFKGGLREGLHEFSICSWVKTNGSYVGTILSYATEDNDNKLVLHGRKGAAYGSLHFVIGDPAFRELPIVPLIDGDWHHTCFIWSSIQGRYWFYVDRRLASTGSRFQKGYEIPPGGSLVLGQEQDTPGGGFDSSEAFVGHLAGFAMWKRALSPGEVSGVATGRGLPRGTMLTLADASSLHGSVRRVKCSCLEHCL